MSISPITSSPSYSHPIVHEEFVSSSTQQKPVQLPGTDDQQTKDIVHLSQIAHIQQMSQQGESASAIATSTGLPVSQVDADLGIPSTSSSVSIAAPSAQGGGQPTASTSAADASDAAPAPAADAAPVPTFSVRA